MKIIKLALQTHKLEELKHFYVDKLGFELLEDQADSFTLKAGTSELMFEKTKTEESIPFYHFAFNISHNLIMEAKSWAENQGLTLLTEDEKDVIDFPHWNAQAIYFYDPVENIVEFIARRDLDNTSTSAFDSRQVTEISEIGLPSHSVEETYNSIQQAFDVPVYSHISNMKTFCAAGDPSGLFIIVPIERPWFLTEKPNGTYYTKVIVQGKEQKQITLNNLPYIIESTTA